MTGESMMYFNHSNQSLQVTIMQPSITGYSDNAISFSWVAASQTGIAVSYDIYYSQFNPAVDITVPAFVTLVKNITTTAYTFENFTLNRYYQFAVQAINSLGEC